MLGTPITHSLWKRFWNWWWRNNNSLKRYATHYYNIEKVSLKELAILTDRGRYPFGKRYVFDWWGNDKKFGEELAIEYNKIRGKDRV